MEEHSIQSETEVQETGGDKGLLPIMSTRANSGASHGGSVKSGKSATSSRSKSSKSVKMSRTVSAAGSSAQSEASAISGKKAGSTSEEVDENGFVHIDMNNQGLTAIANNVFDRQKVMTLDLGCNNLRTIPPSISKLQTLSRLCVSKNSIRCSNANDYSGLPAELASLIHLEDLDVSECNFPHVPPAIWRIPNLKYLNISRNKINMLVPEVGNLMKLTHLNAQSTNISTLPPEIAFCQDLEVLLLFGNVIDSLPETLKELPVLHTLAINYQSFCSIFDAYDMDDLLMKGQIPSEHIPQVLFDIPSLRALNFEETKINTLPEKCTAQLEEFYLQRNFLARVPTMVADILTLKVIDISDNFLTSLPDELGQLRSLETFRADNNKIESIPVSLGHMVSLEHLSLGGNKIEVIPHQIGHLLKLKSLVLDRNKIMDIPETIVKLKELSTLDLTSNQITALPICFYKVTSLLRAHTYDKLSKTGLWLHLNPIKIPPEEIWKTEDPKKIFKYLKKLEIKRTENLQRQKLVILGEAGCGKTSLLNTMMTGKSFLTSGQEARTQMVEHTNWTTENDVTFMVLDMGGSNVYQSVYPVFLNPTSLYFLVYDHRRYTSQNHYSAIGYWLNLLQLYAPGAIVKIIGTQTDNISEAISAPALEIITNEIDKQLADNDKNLQTEIEKLEEILSKENIEKHSVKYHHMKLQKRRMEKLRKMPLRIHGDIALVSSGDGIPGILQLVEELEYLAVDKKLRPQGQRFITDNWKGFRTSLKLVNDHFIEWKQMEAMAKKHGIKGSVLAECIDFLVDSGDILWFKNIPDLQRVIFQNPRKLVEILSALLRNDLDTFLRYPDNLVFTSKGQFTTESFIEAKEALTKWGQISRPMLQCLWFYLRLDYDDFNYLCDLIPRLDLCYCIPQPEIPFKQHVFYPLLTVPWYVTDQAPDDKDLPIWDKSLPNNHMELKVEFIFPTQYPQGLFERLSCRIHNLVSNRIDWQDMIVAVAEQGHGDETKVLLHRFLDTKDYTPVMSVKARSMNLIAASDVMKEICGNVCYLLRDYPGMIWYFNFTKVNCKEASVENCFPEGALP